MLTLISAALATAYAQLDLGEQVPDFSALDQDQSEWKLSDGMQQNDFLVLYFYPAAFTGGCTKQACSYRDQKSDLEALGAGIVGISGDKAETLKLFAQQHNLNFTLLSDHSGELAHMFGVPQGEGGSIMREIQGRSLNLERGSTIQRWTFVVDKQGKLIYKDSEVDAVNDSQKVLDFIQKSKELI